MAAQNGISGHTKIRARQRNLVAGPAAVKLSTIDELMMAVEEKEIRSASSAEGFGNVLGRVHEVGEGVTCFRNLLLHPLRTIVWKRNSVVRIDRNDSEPFR